VAVGLTRGELVQIAGLQSNSVQHYEEERKQPHRASKDKLAQALGVPMEVLDASPTPVELRPKAARRNKKKR
jgi:transcriptional regulator with XRE-family HTH domain